MRTNLQAAILLLAFGAMIAATAPASEIANRGESDIPAAGGLTALPKETIEPVALANPAFEEQWAGWQPPQAEASSIVTDPGTAHSGRACLRFDGNKQTSYVPSVRQPLPHAGPGVYTLRFWLKLREMGSKAA